MEQSCLDKFRNFDIQVSSFKNWQVRTISRIKRFSKFLQVCWSGEVKFNTCAEAERTKWGGPGEWGGLLIGYLPTFLRLFNHYFREKNIQTIKHAANVMECQINMWDIWWFCPISSLKYKIISKFLSYLDWQTRKTNNWATMWARLMMVLDCRLDHNHAILINKFFTYPLLTLRATSVSLRRRVPRQTISTLSLNLYFVLLYSEDKGWAYWCLDRLLWNTAMHAVRLKTSSVLNRVTVPRR